jgi:hypothetical protein
MRRLIEVFDNLQRHTLEVGSEPPVVLRTELSELQGTRRCCTKGSEGQWTLVYWGE